MRIGSSIAASTTSVATTTGASPRRTARTGVDDAVGRRVGGRAQPRGEGEQADDDDDLQHRQRGRGLQVEDGGGQQVDLGLDRRVADPAEGEHDPEGGRAEEEDDARGSRRSRAAAPAG